MKGSTVTVKRGLVKRKSKIISKIQNNEKSSSCSKINSCTDTRQRLQNTVNERNTEASEKAHINLIKPKSEKKKKVEKVITPVSNLDARTENETSTKSSITKNTVQSNLNTRKRKLKNAVTETGLKGSQELRTPKVEKCKKRKYPAKESIENVAEKQDEVKTEKRVRKTIKETNQINVPLVSSTTNKDRKNIHITKQKSKRVVSKESIKDVTKKQNILKPTNLKKTQIRKGIAAVLSLAQQESKSKNALFQEEHQPIFLQVTCVKIPKVSTRQLRMLLPHALVTDTDDVALFVKDLQRGRRKDYEPTVNHFKDLLNEHDCTAQIKEVISMNQVKTEFGQYELKRRLISSYDFFLIDGRIAGHMSHLLGKIFIQKRKLPTSIRMDSKDLKEEIDRALKKTCMLLHSRGNTHIVQVGHTSMDEQKILENILSVSKHLVKNYPGSWQNIRSLYLKTASSLAIPIYITLKSNNTVKVPVIPPKRPKAYQSVRDELSTFPGNVSVTVAPDGNVTVHRRSYVKGNKIKNNINSKKNS